MREAHEKARLQWQSRLLVVAIVSACAISAAIFSTRMWGPDTRNSLLVSLAFALAAWLARAATPAAAITGGILTAAMVLTDHAPLQQVPFAGYPGAGHASMAHSALWPLLTLLLLTFLATRFGRRRKEQLGLAEARCGRNAAQVVANLGIAALAGAVVLALSLLHHPARPALARVMLVAALAEATADTISSELGEVLGGRPFLITTGRRVLPGTDGAVSLAGTLSGILGACVVVLVAQETIGLRPYAAIAAGAGAFAGLFVDSLLGATLEKRGWLNNDAVNFLSTLAAALLGLAFLLG